MDTDYYGWSKETIEAHINAQIKIQEIIMASAFERVGKYRVLQDRLSAAQPFATQVIVTDGGPWASHNVPCTVCGDNGAVLDLNKGVFMPCDNCKKNGWSLALLKKHWWQFWRRRA